MKFLCLAYGNEKDWLELPEERRAELVARDEVLRRRGDLVSVLGPPTVVRAWDGPVTRSSVPFATGPAPLVGVSIVEAESLDEAVELVGGTPCAVAGGAIEVRPLVDLPT